MSKRGGYKIIDLQNMNLQDGESYSIDGLYDSIEANHRKATLLSGVVVDGVEKADAFVVFEHTDDQYSATIPQVGTITILSDNTVSFTPISESEEE